MKKTVRPVKTRKEFINNAIDKNGHCNDFSSSRKRRKKYSQDRSWVLVTTQPIHNIYI